MNETITAHLEKNVVRNRTYYIDHKKKLLAYAKNYRIAHLEEMRAKDRAYDAAHRDENRSRNKIYYAAHKKEAKIYYATHREKFKARDVAYNVSHRTEIQKSHRLRTYGLSSEGFQMLLDKQGGICAICKKGEWGNSGPHVDHCHITGKIRGILCHKCNSALGLISDDLKIAQAIIPYLEEQS